MQWMGTRSLRLAQALRLVVLVIGMSSASAHPMWAADPDVINVQVQENRGDPRHAEQLGTLSYETGDDEEKAQLLGALGQIEAMFHDSTLWNPENDRSIDYVAAYERAEIVVRGALDDLTQDIAGERNAPGSVPFVEAWASQFTSRFTDREGDEGPELVFGDASIAIVPLPESIALHVWFTHVQMAAVWNAFASGSTAEVARAALMRERLWRSFNDIAYSLYPWEQAVNGLLFDYGDLDKFPRLLFIVAHPSVAIEVSSFGHPGPDQLDDLRASEVFLIECGVQLLTRAGGASAGLYSKGFGIGAILGLVDDHPVGYGALLHYGTAIHVGTLYRAKTSRDSEAWSGLVGLDLYGLLRN